VLFKDNENDSSEQIMTNILAPELPEKIAELPQPFLEIVRRCVVKDARHRAQRADELIALLNRPAEEEPVVIEPPVMSTPAVAEAPAIVEFPAVAESPAVAEPSMIAEPAEREPVEVVVPKEVVAPADPEPLVRRMDEPYVPLSREFRPRRRMTALAIVALIVVLAVPLYIFIQNRQQQPDLGYSQPGKDSIPAANGALPPATPPQGQTEQAGHVPATTAATSPTGAAGGTSASGGTEKKPSPSHKDPVQRVKTTDESTKPAAGGTEPEKYVLLLTTPTTCTININNTPYGELEPGKTMKVYLVPGNYIIQATSTADTSAVYTGRLVVEAANLNQVGKYQIPL
jgi:hypothetical protein